MLPDEVRKAMEVSRSPRVDALIERVMQKHPGFGVSAQARYYEAVHQELAPLARDQEAELATIRARLVELEAENERLNAAWDSSFKQAMLNGQSAQEQRARAERAEANLEAANKAVDTYREMLVSIIKVVRERDDRELQAHIDATGITAHLENSRG